MRADSIKLIQAYYDAFNAQDISRFLALLSDDVVHDINQGCRENGKQAFSAFMRRMNIHYREQIIDLVVMSDDVGEHMAAEFTVVGTYLQTDDELPTAYGQSYRLRAGAFFDVKDNRIARVSNYYNLTDWIAQVGKG